MITANVIAYITLLKPYKLFHKKKKKTVADLSTEDLSRICECKILVKIFVCTKQFVQIVYP